MVWAEAETLLNEFKVHVALLCHNHMLCVYASMTLTSRGFR